MENNNKAVPYINYTQTLLGAYGDLPEIHLHGNYVEILHLYSTPFTPECILKYFEGWKERQSEVYVNLFGEGTESVTNIIELYFDKIDMITYGNNIIRNDYPEQIYRVYKPASLDHFISDCNRAGIELIWKKDIKEKYGL